MSLITLNPGETRQITWAASQSSSPPVKNYLIANLDETGTIFIGPADSGRQVPDLTTDISRSQLVALQAVSVNASQDWYAFNPSGGLFNNVFSNTFTGAPITIDVLPDTQYWAPSPYQQALSLVDQGLMKDSTGQNILGQATSTVTNTGNALSVGVPPNVPNIQSASTLQKDQSTSPVTFFTAVAAGRIWAVSLSAAVLSGTSFSGGRQSVYVQVKAGAVVLEVLEMGVSAATQNDSDHGDLNLYGLPFANGTSFVLDINNGMTVTDMVIRASVNVLYSIP